MTTLPAGGMPPDVSQEEWRPAPGWEAHYEVSSHGRIRKQRGQVLGMWLNDQGYVLARLSNPRELVRVHRLVAGAFVSNPSAKPVVNHLDSDRANNHYKNLEWCTQAENLSHATASGHLRRDYWAGRRSPQAKLSDETASEIRAAYRKGSVSHQYLATAYGISKRSIGRIISGESYA